jgi:hypothetical protein
MIRPRDGLVFGGGAYLSYSVLSRFFLTRSHRTGISQVRRQQFGDAIESFQKSLAFFDRHPRVDRFRSIVLMSASAASYREMALANIAFCYVQLGNGDRARRYYELCQEQFPESALASAALRMMDVARDSAPRVIDDKSSSTHWDWPDTAKICPGAYILRNHLTIADRNA